jgi:hypothetical protein
MKKTIQTVLPYVTEYNAEHYNAQTPMTKKEFLKLQPGTWLEIRWLDGPNSVVLLLEKPKRNAGDITFTCWSPTPTIQGTTLESSQVIRVQGKVKVPEIICGNCG